MFHVTRGDTLVLSEDEACSASIVPARGAIATSFRVKGRELFYLDEATLRDGAKNVRGGIPLLFPSPGRLRGDRFERDGKSGAMKQHGFARDLPWEVIDVDTTGAARATLALASTDATRAQFPWDFRLALTFSVRDATLRLDLRVENTGRTEMPFAFGIHPYFHVTDKASARVTTRATRAFDNVTKEIVPFRGLDLTLPEVDLHLIDHGSTESTLSWGDAREGGRVAIRASAELTQWVIWTVRGKDYVCVEPWTSPGDALNTGESLLRVAPGAARSLWVEMEYLDRA